jgi:hypothetical protein
MKQTDRPDRSFFFPPWFLVFGSETSKSVPGWYSSVLTLSLFVAHLYPRQGEINWKTKNGVAHFVNTVRTIVVSFYLYSAVHSCSCVLNLSLLVLFFFVASLHCP